MLVIPLLVNPLEWTDLQILTQGSGYHPSGIDFVKGFSDNQQRFVILTLHT